MNIHIDSKTHSKTWFFYAHENLGKPRVPLFWKIMGASWSLWIGDSESLIDFENPRLNLDLFGFLVWNPWECSWEFLDECGCILNNWGPNFVFMAE